MDDEEGSVPEADLLTSLSDRLDEMELVAARRRRLLWIGGVAGVLVAALVTVLVNFAVDLMYAALDPRIRYSD